MPSPFLPALNAILNSCSAILLICGFIMIKRRRIDVHRRFMIAAFITSVLFLISYLTYHYTAGATKFPGTGTIRIVYFTILITHTILAALVPVLAIITLTRATRAQFERHKRIARWTLPIWLYVSVTGVIIYFMLYR